MPEMSTARWRAVTTAIATLDRAQAEALLGIELMLDIVEAGCTAGGVPYSARELADAADTLLQRRR